MSWRVWGDGGTVTSITNLEILTLLCCLAAYISGYRRFGPIHQSPLQGSSLNREDRTDRLFRNVDKYRSTIRNIPEERRSHLCCGGSLESRTINLDTGSEWVLSLWLRPHYTLVPIRMDPGWYQHQSRRSDGNDKFFPVRTPWSQMKGGGVWALVPLRRRLVAPQSRQKDL